MFFNVGVQKSICNVYNIFRKMIPYNKPFFVRIGNGFQKTKPVNYETRAKPRDNTFQNKYE